MKIKKQFQELARIEKYNPIDGVEGWWSNGRRVIMLQDPIVDYTSLDVLHRVICGMDEETLDRYMTALAEVVDPDGLFMKRDCIRKMHKATPAQVREAILRAYGKWEVE